MDELPIGRRVACWRTRRKMSQQVFADLLGKSKSWVDKVERGVRKLDRFSTIHEIAGVLQVDVYLLLGRDPVRRPDGGPGASQAEVAEIRAAMERYDKIGAFFFSPPKAPALGELGKATDHAWMTFQHSKFGVLVRMLPKLLRDAQAANAVYSGEDGRRAASLLAQAYQVASSTLRKIGEYDLAWLAADRAVTASQRSEDDLLSGLATTRVGNALAALGRFRSALELDVNVANKVAPAHESEATPERLSVYGLALLQGAMAAARMDDPATAADLISAAQDAADQIGGDHNYYWTNFGPTNVAFHKVAAYVEIGEGARAVITAQSIPPEALAAMMPERRGSFLLDLARALAQIGEPARAGETLVEADRVTSGGIRCRPVVQELLTGILRRTNGRAPAPVVDLADQMGLWAV